MNNISIFISIFCLVFCLLLFFYIKWYIKRKVSASELSEYKIEVNRLKAEIDAVTDRDITLVEERIKKLKEIIEEADRRVKVYVQELDRSRTGEALYTSLGKGIRAALKTSPDIPPETKLTLVRQESEFPAEFKAEIPRKPVESPVQAPPLSSKPKPPSQKQIRAQIDELVKENLSPAEIASRLGISIAEVDLVMNLMNNKK